MMIPLGPVKLPAWLERTHRLRDVADQLENAGKEMQRRVHARMPLERAEYEPLLDEAAALSRDAAVISAIAKLRPVVASLDEPTIEDAGLTALRWGLNELSAALMKARGAEIFARGEFGIRLAIVGTLQRGSHTAVYVIRDGSEFGIDDGTLARFIDELLDEGILESSNNGYSLTLGHRGRKWFEQQVGAVPPRTDGNGTEVLFAAEADSALRETLNHLSFIENAQLRRIAERTIAEIELTQRGHAWLATMILCGTLLEAMMMAIVEQRPGEFAFASKANWEERASIRTMVSELIDLGLLKQSTTVLMIADGRNFVHPNRQMKDQDAFRADVKDAAQMVIGAATVAHDLYDACLVHRASS